MAPARDGPGRDLIGIFRRARHDPTRAVLEGFHPIKHAIRFGAEIEHACASDESALQALTRRLAPDVEPALHELVRYVPPAVFAEMAPVPPETGIIAIARRPEVDAGAILESTGAAPVVFLERPTHLGNLGAAVRVAAAAGAAAVLTTGPQDPWHPTALRGSAGLHFALPVVRIDAAPTSSGRPLLALHPEGECLRPDMLPDDAILAFGSERWGLSDALLGVARRRIALPMRPGVSSLNLASAVAATLYAWRLARTEPLRAPD